MQTHTVRKSYTPPQLDDFGDVAEITATLGDPFTGDVSFDVDGNILNTDLNCVHQCPTRDLEVCMAP